MRAIAFLLSLLTTQLLPAAEPAWTPLFAENGPPAGWRAQQWHDVALPADEGVAWQVKDGVLHGSEPRGTWLVSDAVYADFELELEFLLGERGNSGLALRSPPRGDPAFDGLELQMADLRYNTEATEAELTGGLYRALAPREQVYRPTEWNKLYVRLEGSRLYATLNDAVIHDIDLADYDAQVKRHDGTDAPALKDRPRSGHIGFQELSRDGAHVQIRAARLRVMDVASP